MGLFSLFKSSDGFNPLTMEKDLEEIKAKIISREKRVIKHKKQAKSIKKHFLLISSIIYTIYVGYYGQTQKYLYDFNRYYLYGLIGGLVVLMGGYCLITVLNDKVLKRHLDRIKYYKVQYLSKIEEFKVKTDFNNTRRLLNKYSVKDLKVEATKIQIPNANNNEETENAEKVDLEFLENANDSDYEAQLSSIESRYDKQEQLRRKRDLIKQGKYQTENPSALGKVMEILLGKDEMSPQNRYALICIDCFAHNGLAPPRYLPNQVKFKCCECGVLNNPEAGGIRSSVMLDSPKFDTVIDDKENDFQPEKTS